MSYFSDWYQAARDEGGRDKYRGDWQPAPKPEPVRYAACPSCWHPRGGEWCKRFCTEGGRDADLAIVAAAEGVQLSMGDDGLRRNY